jgi:hypothetical protein
MKICPVVTELFRADGHMDKQADMAKLIDIFEILQTR